MYKKHIKIDTIKEIGVIDVQKLITNSNNELSKLTVDLIAQPHNISHNWQQRHNIITGREDEKMRKTTEKAILSLKKYNWPGNVRELKNTVESLIVMNKGERITNDMVKLSLGINDYNAESSLPVFTNENSDKVERELILKQLLFLRQDINDVKQILLSQGPDKVKDANPSNPALFLPSTDTDNVANSHGGRESIEDAGIYALNEETIGEVSLEELEHEMIKRCLEKFNGNRRDLCNRASNINFNGWLCSRR